MKKIKKAEIQNLLEVTKSLKTVEGEVRYKIIDNYLLLDELAENWERECKKISDIIKEEVGLTDEMIRTGENIRVNHSGDNSPLTEAEKQASIAIGDYNRKYSKDIERRSTEEIDVDFKTITLDELKKIAKEDKLSVAVEGTLRKYFVE